MPHGPVRGMTRGTTRKQWHRRETSRWPSKTHVAPICTNGHCSRFPHGHMCESSSWKLERDSTDVSVSSYDIVNLRTNMKLEVGSLMGSLSETASVLQRLDVRALLVIILLSSSALQRWTTQVDLKRKLTLQETSPIRAIYTESTLTNTGRDR